MRSGSRGSLADPGSRGDVAANNRSSCPSVRAGARLCLTLTLCAAAAGCLCVWIGRRRLAGSADGGGLCGDCLCAVSTVSISFADCSVFVRSHAVVCENARLATAPALLRQPCVLLRKIISMWSWLPDELLQRIVQLVAERAPRALAIVVLLDQRSRASAAARLARMKPLLTAPFRLTVQRIFDGSGTLDLSGRALRSEGMEVLGLALVSGALPQLEKLWLGRNSIGDAGLSALADVVSRGALAQCTWLDLAGNSIGDAGLIALAKAVESGALDKLDYLRLDQNQIGDAGLQAFADAMGKGALPQLEKIWLGGNSIGDVGLSALADVVSRGALDHLTVRWRPAALFPCLETWQVHSPD